MDHVTLAPGLPASSRLGLGCGSVMGRVSRRESERAIAAALDHGITHFDVARAYGYGEAEALLGTVLKGHRDRVVVASKFGLRAPRASGALRRLKPLAQGLVAAVPGLRPILRSAVGGNARAADRFSVTAAKASLDQSLAALATDYLDILFLHDCEADDLTDELTAFLERRSPPAKSAPMAWRPRSRRWPRSNAGAAGRCCTSSPTASRTATPKLCPAGRAALSRTAPFPAAYGLGTPHREMLGWALAQPNVAVVLCSMLDEAHLRANLAVAEAPEAVG